MTLDLRAPDPPAEHLRNVEAVLVAELQLAPYDPAARRILERFAVRVRTTREALEQGAPAGLGLLLIQLERAILRVRDAAARELLEDVRPRLAKALTR